MALEPPGDLPISSESVKYTQVFHLRTCKMNLLGGPQVTTLEMSFADEREPAGEYEVLQLLGLLQRAGVVSSVVTSGVSFVTPLVPLPPCARPVKDNVLLEVAWCEVDASYSSYCVCVMVYCPIFGTNYYLYTTLIDISIL
jgi:hypothetical protein